MKRVAAIAVVLALVLGLGGAATAGTFTLHPNVVCGAGCTDPVNNVFGLTFVGSVFSDTQSVSVGGTFTDHGALTATGLTSAESTPILPGLTGLNVNWQLGAIFSLPGTITDVKTDPPQSATAPLLTFSFTPGSTITLYAEAINLGSPHNPNNPSTIGDGTVIGTLSLDSGGGNLDFVTGDGNIDLQAHFTSVLAGFWENLGIPIDLNTEVFLAFTNSNNHVQACAPPGAQDQNNPSPPPATISVCTDHAAATTTSNNFNSFFGIASTPDSTIEQTWLSIDGSANFQVAGVPNPSALMLIGMTFAGIASISAYRRRRAA